MTFSGRGKSAFFREKRAEKILCPCAKPTSSALHKAIGHKEIAALTFADHGTMASVDIGLIYALPCCAIVFGNGFQTADTEPRIFTHKRNERAIFDLHDADLAKLIARVIGNDGLRPRFAAVIAVISILHENSRFGIASVNTENMSAVRENLIFVGNDTEGGNGFGCAPRFAFVGRAEYVLYAILEQIFVYSAVKDIANDDDLSVWQGGDTGTVISKVCAYARRERLFFAPSFTLVGAFGVDVARETTTG